MKLLILTNHLTEEDGPRYFAEALSSRYDVYIASVIDNKDHMLGSPFLKCSKYTTIAYNDLILSGHLMDFEEFDAVFYRIDRPVSKSMLRFHMDKYPNKIYINSPDGILKTTGKDFMLNFPDLCPKFEIIDNQREGESFIEKNGKSVLKPLDGFGGKGVLIATPKELLNSEYPIMIMKYLKNVKEGDKRILVLNGEVISPALLRTPKDGSWLCNVAQGAEIGPTDISDKEKKMIGIINPIFETAGIYLYGVDTLVDDDGTRIISEVNTTNSGGFYEGEIEVADRITRLINYLKSSATEQHLPQLY